MGAVEIVLLWTCDIPATPTSPPWGRLYNGVLDKCMRYISKVVFIACLRADLGVIVPIRTKLSLILTTTPNVMLHQARSTIQYDGSYKSDIISCLA